MAVVAVPFILYLVRFCSSKSCNISTSTCTSIDGAGGAYSTGYSTVLVLVLVLVRVAEYSYSYGTVLVYGTGTVLSVSQFYTHPCIDDRPQHFYCRISGNSANS